MSILPKNEPIKPDLSPHNFFIWGDTMSGKSYLAEHFPDLVILSTDKNAKAGTRPPVPFYREEGKPPFSVIDRLRQTIAELQINKDGFKTVSIDVTEDLISFIERELCEKEGVPTLGDFKGFGRGYTLMDMTIKALIQDIRSLPMNVIFISREIDEKDDSNKKLPAIKSKYYNLVTGNCDMSIHTQQVGNKYYRNVDKKRRKYKASEIADPQLLHVLKNIPGALVPENQTKKVGK